MLIPAEPVFHKTLSAALTMKTAATAQDLERISALHAVVHEPAVGVMTTKIFERHPDTTGRDLVYIENETGEVVASLCLIPWTLRFGSVDLPAGELGIVSTLECYRKQGLNRALMEYYWQRFQERGCLLSIIQGIPYFYRQYGYEYAMLPLEGGWRIQPDLIPDRPAANFNVRPAVSADIPLLARWYDEQAGRLDLSARRSPATWEFLLARTEKPEAMQHGAWVVTDSEGVGAGYFRVADTGFHQNLLIVDDASDLSFDAALAVLRCTRDLARERGKDGVRLYLPETASLLRLAKSFGGSDLGCYSWQISIPDKAAFLSRLAPLFEARLADSMFAGLTRPVSLNLFREMIGLDFRAGKLVNVGRAREDENTILNVPPVQLIPLVLGGRTIDEIRASFPDAYARYPWQLLVDTLFPKSRAFFATIY